VKSGVSPTRRKRSPPRPLPMSLSNHISRFWRLLAEEDYEALAAEARLAGPPDPATAEGRELLFVHGMALWRSGQTEQGAIKMLELLEGNAESFQAHLQLANMLDDLEAFDRAERCYQRAHDLAPESPAVISDWGIMLWRAGQMDRALEAFERAEALGGNDDNLHYYWGLSLESLGRFEEAREQLSIYVERGRREPFALARLGVVHSELGDFQRAEGLLREACELEPDSKDHLYNLAVCLKRMGRLGEAELMVRRLIDGSPRRADTWGLLGDIELERGDLDAARSSYGRSLELNPAESYTLSGLAWVEFRDDDPDSAERLAQQALAADPGNLSALDLIRAARAEQPSLNRYSVEIYGQTSDSVHFFKAMDCLAESEEQAAAYVDSIQKIFPHEVWWEIEEMCLVDAVQDERPGVFWISDYDFADEPAT
jgi:tetratricopeptide (TPR) repeat protein